MQHKQPEPAAFYRKLKRGRDYSAGSTLDIIAGAANHAEAKVMYDEAVATTKASAKTRRKWLAVVEMKR